MITQVHSKNSEVQFPVFKKKNLRILLSINYMTLSPKDFVFCHKKTILASLVILSEPTFDNYKILDTGM